MEDRVLVMQLLPCPAPRLSGSQLSEVLTSSGSHILVKLDYQSSKELGANIDVEEYEGIRVSGLSAGQNGFVVGGAGM